MRENLDWYTRLQRPGPRSLACNVVATILAPSTLMADVANSNRTTNDVGRSFEDTATGSRMDQYWMRKEVQNRTKGILYR